MIKTETDYENEEKIDPRAGGDNPLSATRERNVKYGYCFLANSITARSDRRSNARPRNPVSVCACKKGNARAC